MYTSVNVLAQTSPELLLMNGPAISSANGQQKPYITNATAHVVNGGQYVLVTPPQTANVELTAGKPYKIMGAGGLNLVAVYIGQTAPEPNSTTQQPMRFKVGN